MPDKDNQIFVPYLDEGEGIIPFDYECNIDGVDSIKWCDEPAQRVRIFFKPVWVLEVINNADCDDAHAVIEWVLIGDGHRKQAIPLHILLDAGATIEWLARRGILASNIGLDSEVSTYLWMCAQEWLLSHEPRIVENPGLDFLHDETTLK